MAIDMFSSIKGGAVLYKYKRADGKTIVYPWPLDGRKEFAGTLTVDSVLTDTRATIASADGKSVELEPWDGKDDGPLAVPGYKIKSER